MANRDRSMLTENVASSDRFASARTRARTVATGGAVLWVGMVAFGGSTVAVLAVLSRHPHHVPFSSLAALLSLSFVLSLIPAGVQLRSAALVADGRPPPAMTAGQVVLTGAAALAVSPVLALLLLVPVEAAALVAIQMVVAIPLAARQGALLAQHRFGALGINFIIEGVARFGLGALAGLTLGVTGVAAGLSVGTLVALVAIPYRRTCNGGRDRPRTSLIDTSLSLALLGLYVQLDVLVAPSLVAPGGATAFDVAAVPSKGVYLVLLAGGALLFPFVRSRQSSRGLVMQGMLVTLAAGVACTGLLMVSRPLIADLLGRHEAALGELGLLGLAMAFAGATALVTNASVARGVRRPWPPLVLGIALLLSVWPLRPGAETFAIFVAVSQGATAVLGVVVCLWGQRRTSFADASL